MEEAYLVGSRARGDWTSSRGFDVAVVVGDDAGPVDVATRVRLLRGSIPGVQLRSVCSRGLGSYKGSYGVLGNRALLRRGFALSRGFWIMLELRLGLHQLRG